MSEWNERRERHLRAWVVQMARAATLLERASSVLRWTQGFVTFLSQFCTSYTSIIPVATLGCTLVQGDSCANLQISAIAIAVIGSIIALLDGKISLGAGAKDIGVAVKLITKLARRIDLQLQRDSNHREPVDSFSDIVANEYDEIMDSVPSLPRFVFRRSDLVNLTLLSAYIDAPNTPDNPPLDEYLCTKIDYEMERLQNFSAD